MGNCNLGRFSLGKSQKVPDPGRGCAPLDPRTQGLARGISNQLAAYDRFASKRILRFNGVWTHSFLQAGIRLTSWLSDPIRSIFLDRGEGDANLLFAPDTSPSGQYGQQLKSRVMAMDADLKEGGNSKQRRLLMHNKSFNCADAQVGDPVFFVKPRTATERHGDDP